MMDVIFSPKSTPSFSMVCKWLVLSYVIALSIPVLIYSILAVFSGIFDSEIIMMMIIGFPISIFTDLRSINIDIGRLGSFSMGYGAYLLIAALCVTFRNSARLLKIFMWAFWILLLVNLISCVPRAIMLGLEEIN